MNKLLLTNAEVLQLDVELNGIQSQDESQAKKGILAEPLPIKTRYWLERINSQVSTIKTSVEKFRNELVDKLGQEIDGVKQIPLFIEKGEEKVMNPKIEEFTKEFNTILEQEEELNIPSLSIDDLGDLKTDVVLKVLFKVLEDPE